MLAQTVDSRMDVLHSQHNLKRRIARQHSPLYNGPILTAYARHANGIVYALVM